MTARTGRQTPTSSVIIPYKQTKGQEAIDLYNSGKNKAQEWQELMMYDIMAVDDDGLWVHQKFGYEIPRRNGKGEIAGMRETCTGNHVSEKKSESGNLRQCRHRIRRRNAESRFRN